MHRYFLLLLFTGCALPLFAQDTLSLSLNEAIELALKQSLTLQISQKNISIAQTNNTIGEAGGLPQVSANLSVNNGYSSIDNPTSFLNGAQLSNNATTPSIDATWVLFDGFKVRINRQRLDYLEAQQRGNLRQAVEQQVQQVMRAYFAAQVQERRLQLNAQLLRLSRDKIAYIEARREYGAALEFDKLQIMDAYLNDSIQWVLQKNAHEIALQNLAISVGSTDLQARISIKDTLAYTLPDYNLEELRAQLLSGNQSLQNLKIAESLSQTQIKLQESNKYPRISAAAGISEQLTLARIDGRQPAIPNTWRGGTTFNAYLNFSLSYNLYAGGRVRRSIEVAKLQLEINQLQRQEQERALSQSLALSLHRYNNQRAVLALTQQLAQNAERNLQLAEEKFKAGTLNYFDLRTIQINYIRSINALQDAYLNAKNSEIELLLSVGALVR